MKIFLPQLPSRLPTLYVNLTNAHSLRYLSIGEKYITVCPNDAYTFVRSGSQSDPLLASTAQGKTNLPEQSLVSL